MNCKVMGIVNVTPDSFSDGGKFYRPEEAVRRARNLLAEGADILDFGGESTRPGATPLGWQEEWARLEPVLGEICDPRRAGPGNGARVSVDTYHPETAARAVAAGATIINCVYAEPVPAMLEILASNPGVELVLPAACYRQPTVPGSPDFSDLLPRLYLDPMIGFGTTREEDLSLLQSVAELARQGRVLVGASRKRIVKKLTGVKTPGKDLAGNLAIALWAAQNGASVVRVHDVRETVQLFKVWNALSESAQ